MYLSMAVWYCVSDEFLGIGVIAQMEAFSSGRRLFITENLPYKLKPEILLCYAAELYFSSIPLVFRTSVARPSH